MKIVASKHPQSGSVLLLTLLTCVIIGVSLAGYLEFARQQNQMVYRSQTWNLIMPACEAGVEEALAHLNTVMDQDRAVNGWTSNQTGFALSRTVGDMRYDVTITVANPPVVISTGYMKQPLSTNEMSRTVRVETTKFRTGMIGLVAKGGISLGPGSVVDSWDSRLTGAYSALGARSNAFVGAVNGNLAGSGGGGTTIKGDVATGPSGTITAITFTGSSSSDLNMSFPDVTAPFNPGSAFAPSGGTVSITNYTTGYETNTTGVWVPPTPTQTVYTNVLTQTNYSAPLPPTTYTTQNTTITSASPPPPGTNPFNVIVGARLSNRPSLPANNSGYTTYRNEFRRANGRYDFDPVTHWTWSGTSYVYNTTNYVYVEQTRVADSVQNVSFSYILDSDNYIANSISLSGQNKMLVRGNAKLWVTSSLDMTGQSQITILEGASLELYCGQSSGSGATVNIAGNGVVNQSGNSESMAIYGLPSCTAVYVRGNGAYVGTIYAPQATLYGKGGGNDVDDIQGAAVMGAVSFNGHVNFHYDEKLGDNGGVTRWRIASWSEM